MARKRPGGCDPPSPFQVTLDDVIARQQRRKSGFGRADLRRIDFGRAELGCRRLERAGALLNVQVMVGVVMMVTILVRSVISVRLISVFISFNYDNCF